MRQWPRWLSRPVLDNCQLPGDKIVLLQKGYSQEMRDWLIVQV